MPSPLKLKVPLGYSLASGEAIAPFDPTKDVVPESYFVGLLEDLSATFDYRDAVARINGVPTRPIFWFNTAVPGTAVLSLIDIEWVAYTSGRTTMTETPFGCEIALITKKFCCQTLWSFVPKVPRFIIDPSDGQVIGKVIKGVSSEKQPITFKEILARLKHHRDTR